MIIRLEQWDITGSMVQDGKRSQIVHTEHSFDNVPDPKYKFTRKQAINFHLVGSLRPKFNKYVKSMGGKATWKVIAWEQ